MSEAPDDRLRRLAGALALTPVALLVLVAGCTADDGPGAAPTPTPSSTPTPTPTPPPTAEPVRGPRDRACYPLTYAEAVSPTTDVGAIGCMRPHTSQTFAVGQVDNLVEGHLLAIDSQRVQDGVARDCPAALAEAVGGTRRDLRLSMLRAVWFTPTLEEAGEGAAWYRCDVVVLAGEDKLVSVRRPLVGVLATPEGRDRFAMCGTASPDAADFERVPCSAPHTWRAFEVLGLPAGRYPGRAAVAEAGEGPCEDAAAGVAADPLDYDWAYEGPDAEQWATGQTFVRCWAPD